MSRRRYISQDIAGGFAVFSYAPFSGAVQAFRWCGCKGNGYWPAARGDSRVENQGFIGANI